MTAYRLSVTGRLEAPRPADAGELAHVVIDASRLAETLEGEHMVVCPHFQPLGLHAVALPLGEVVIRHEGVKMADVVGEWVVELFGRRVGHLPEAARPHPRFWAAQSVRYQIGANE